MRRRWKFWMGITVVAALGGAGASFADPSHTVPTVRTQPGLVSPVPSGHTEIARDALLERLDGRPEIARDAIVDRLGTRTDVSRDAVLDKLKMKGSFAPAWDKLRVNDATSIPEDPFDDLRFDLA